MKFIFMEKHEASKKIRMALVNKLRMRMDCVTLYEFHVQHEDGKVLGFKKDCVHRNTYRAT
jgi:hypothetical protein